MIRPAHHGIEGWLCVEPVDFRKQIMGLATLVQDQLSMDPFSSQLFVFTNRRRTQCRILYWERCGFVLWHKRLERERFAWPRHGDAVVSLTGAQLNFLLLPFVGARTRKPVDRLAVHDLTPRRVLQFLAHIEDDRGCSVQTRNQRLTAARAFARFVASRDPGRLEWSTNIRALALKRATPRKGPRRSRSAGAARAR